jgi:hypothetical protein
MIFLYECKINKLHLSIRNSLERARTTNRFYLLFAVANMSESDSKSGLIVESITLVTAEFLTK